MRTRLGERGECAHGGVGGFGELLRTLLRGIPWSERAEATETLHFEAPAAGALRIALANGRSRVWGEDRDDVEVTVHKVARAESQAAARRLVDAMQLVRVQSDEGVELSVETPRRWNRRGSANLALRVPRGLRVDVSSSNGKIQAEGLRAGARTRTSNGGVQLSDIEGDVEVHASNAKVRCEGLRGRLVARTSNGKIEIAEHRGSIDASTSNGLIQAEVLALDPAGILLATSNGRIVLSLPEEVDADVDLRVDNGVIRNQRSLCRCSHSRGGRLAGRFGSGGAPIRLRTSNGSISLR